MKKIFLIILFFITIQTSALALSNTKKVYLNQAIEAALNNNIDLQATKLNGAIAKNEVKAANRLQNPSFDAFYFMGAAGNEEPKQFGLSENFEIAKRSARKNLAKSNLKLVEKNIDYTIFDLKMDVREAYINLVAAKSILFTLEHQQELQEELLKIDEENNYVEMMTLSPEYAFPSFDSILQKRFHTDLIFRLQNKKLI